MLIEAQDESAAAFIEAYGPYLGHRRLEQVRASGKFIVEAGADGAYIRDTAGNRYLDFFLATGVFTLGHRNPAVGQAVRAALEAEDYGGVFYFSEAKGALARRLVETTPAGLDLVLPAVGGGEAIDLALKLCMAATGRTEIVCAEGAYHGSAGLTAELGPQMLRDWYPLQPLTVHRVPVGDAAALAAVLSERVAACIFEPLRSLIDGQRPPPGYWQEVRRLCDRNGSRLIVDEVVCGLGRLGHLWGSGLDGVAPDILVSAKGLSGGYFPMAALVLRPDLLDSWGDNPFRAYSTYAWSNVGARTALAALAETERLLPAAMAAGDILEAALQGLRQRYPELISDVRRTGMHFVVRPDGERLDGRGFTIGMLRRGVLLQASGAYPDAPAKLMPPLILERAHIEDFTARAEDLLDAVRAGQPAAG